MKRGARRDLGKVLEGLARAGYGARGFVYISIGAIAVLAAVELAPRASGSRGALAALEGWPLGRVWLMAVASGLLGFAAWRFMQAFLDADHQGRETAALAARAGQGLSGLVYAALAVSVFHLTDLAGDVAQVPRDGGAHEQAAQVMTLPFGRWLLVAIGLFVLGAGAGNIIRGFRSDFGKRLSCSIRTRPWACGLARFGYAARGVAFLPLGLFMARAGLDSDTGEAKDLGGALQTLEQQPFGSWILAFTAVGLIAFGLFALVEARYRRIDATPRR